MDTELEPVPGYSEVRKLLLADLRKPLSQGEASLLGLGDQRDNPSIGWWEDTFFKRAKEIGPTDPPVPLRVRALMRYLTPRRYNPPRNYGALVDWALAYAVAFDEFTQLKDEDEGQRYQLMSAFHLAWLLSISKVPTWYIGRDLLEKLLLSDPPADTIVGDLPWPMPAMVFMLPKERFSITRADGHVENIIAVAGAPLNNSTGAKHLIIVMLLQAAGGVLWPYAQLVELDRSLSECMASVHNRPEEVQATFGAGISVFFRIWLYMLARPEFVEKERLQRSEYQDRSGGISKEALWSPNLLGAVEVASILMGCTHASPRLHWRRGHYRRQPIGPAEKREHKILWIEPMLIAGSDPEPTR